MTNDPPQQPVVLRLDDIVRAVEARRRGRIKAFLKGLVLAVPAVGGAVQYTVSYLEGLVDVRSAAVVATFDERVGERLQPYDARPYVDRLTVSPVNPTSFVIAGTGFGPARGGVELFYKLEVTGSLDANVETRSATVTLSGEQIMSWSDQELAVQMTDAQRDTVLSSIGQTDFRDMRPYIRVLTADGRRTSLW